MSDAWRICVLALPLLLAPMGQAKCKSNEECVTVQRCLDSDDSGTGIITVRMDKSCGLGLTCCDKEQLETWDANLKSNPFLVKQQNGINSRSNPNTKNNESSKHSFGYESCGDNMECVPRHLCNGTINDDGRFLIQGRFGKVESKKKKDPCAHLQKCCPIEDKLAESRFDDDKFTYKGCGTSNPTGLIFNLEDYEDDVSLFGEFPWMVLLLTGRSQHIGGGTIIHPKLVLTAAHVVENYTIDSMVARAGEWDLNTLDEPLKHQAVRIKQIITHEDYVPEGLFNDIALLVLAEPLVLAPHIQPLCLPPVESPMVLDQFRSAECYATGWGGRLPNSKEPERLLKRISLPVLKKDECQDKLRLTKLGHRFRLRPSFICAGGEIGKDTCQGDGGSPLFCKLPGSKYRYQLAGIVSWGIECSQQNVPAVYANVPHLHQWIDDKVASLNLTLEFP